jgi:hypothetical protein
MQKLNHIILDWKIKLKAQGSCNYDNPQTQKLLPHHSCLQLFLPYLVIVVMQKLNHTLIGVYIA